MQAPSPPHSREVAHAQQAYRNAELEYHIVTGCHWPALPVVRSLKVHHWWRQVEMAKRRLALVQGQRDTAGATTSP